ncbi:IMP dehydrogenase, partial [Streptomyces sp. NPDC001588]
VGRGGATFRGVGLPPYNPPRVGFGRLSPHNTRRAGAPAPARASIDQLLPDILSGAIEPGKVFDATTGLDGVPAGYQDMADRNSLKVLIKP